MFLRTTLACLLCLPTLIGQGTERLTLESIAHPTQKKAYVGAPSTRLEWLPDGALLQTRREGGQIQLLRVDPSSWKEKPLLDASRLEAALVEAGALAAKAKEALGHPAFTWNQCHSAFLVTVADALYLVEAERVAAKRLVPGEVDEPTFSPDGTWVAYLRENDLYAVPIASGREIRLTTGGSETVFNGRLDWVYQEEVYGRGDFKAFWWSPDSTRLAFLSLDEAKVPVFTLMDDRFQPQKALKARYPKAGDPNPTARLGVVDLTGHTVWTANPYPDQQTLIVQVGWDPKGRLLAMHQDRIQTWLDLRRYEAGASRVLIHEAGKSWQERLPLPIFLSEGDFLWESGRTGRQHIYHHDLDGRPLGAVTAGSWDVRKVHGVDPPSGRVFFDATERSPIGLDTYSIRLDGQGLTRLTERPGTHRVRFNPTFTAFLDTWSDIHTPPQQSLQDGTGQRLRLIDANPSELLKTLQLGEVRFQQVPTRDGFAMESMLVLPPGFDPGKVYPVYQYIYGGPGAPMVRNAWSRDLLWYQFLAQQGIVTWICDNRSASGKGSSSAQGIYRNLGAEELRDQLDGHAWLKAQGWADMGRICLDGWSFGGYLTAFALTHSSAWKVGIAGAPVTDWSLYDSIYTERYMGLPAANPEGYAASSVLKAAADLSGKLLILHGTLDDNVHPQNTVMLIDALQKAGKDFDLRLYPGSNHVSAFGKPSQNWDIVRARWAFISRNL